MAMKIWFLSRASGAISVLIAITFETCIASTQFIGQIKPDIGGSQMNWIDNRGIFLLSDNLAFGFGFLASANDVTLFSLSVVHRGSSIVIWTANRGYLVRNSDQFVFDKLGNVNLEYGDTVIWSTNTSGKGVTAMELQNSGNLVLLDGDSKPLWESFRNPTDTLLPGQDFIDGMRLVSNPNEKNLTYFLEIKSGDMKLYAGFQNPQPYWSMQQDSRKTNDKFSGDIYMATLILNSWMLYDRNHSLLSRFILLSPKTDPNVTWAAVLGNDGLIKFYILQDGPSDNVEDLNIPQDSCENPEQCNPYFICSSGNQCECPTSLQSLQNCDPGIISPCSSKSSVKLIDFGDGLRYSSTSFVSPISKHNLTDCKEACMGNCSCLALFFQENTGSCFMFDQIGSLQQTNQGSTGYVSYIKVSSNEDGVQNFPQEESSGGKRFPFVVIIAVVTVLVIAALVFLAYRYIRKPKSPPDPSGASSEEDTFLETISGMPIRFSYRDLQTATNNFSVKLGQGGFGSVYQGNLPDGSQVAVKKLEGIGQGKKEFRAEVSIIGSIHHVHLVRLRGFCAEGTHRLLAYEYMANGSLDRWIFQNKNEGFELDWEKRFNIALATAKGLAYLHEDCDVKIVHCDIKPENVLLDSNFHAKVSDFGLAKLMSREQSHVFTTLRGTRGYLAPEWITNYAISEKSDVYSFGMVLLEIIGGRKNFDPTEISEKAHFPSYAFKMQEEGKLKEILDAKLLFDEKDERVSTAIKVALWCIQEDTHLRPSMTKVVQMLEGLSDVPQPPTSSQIGFRLYANIFKSGSDTGTSSAPSDYNSNALLSAVQLSGPR